MSAIKQLFYETKAARGYYSASKLWLSGAALLTAAYLIFALLLVGIPGLSRGGAFVAVAAFIWCFFGFIVGAATLRPILILPMLFYVVTIASGFTQPIYPIEYIGQITTIWLGAISIGFFLTNGVSVKLIVAGLILICIANLVAISIGYEGYQINVKEETLESIDNIEVKRSSGLASHPNILLVLALTLPFTVFLLERRINFLAYLILVCVCITATIYTGSRSGLPLSMLFIVCGALFLLQKGFWRNLTIFFGLIGTVLVIQYLTNPDILSMVSNSPLGDVVVIERVIAGLDGSDQSAITRAALVADSWQYYYNKLWFGHGPNMFSEVAGGDRGMYAHNNFVEIGVNWGVVGQLTYYISYVAIFVRMFVVNRIALLTPLLFLIIADQWVVLFMERSTVLMLCAMLAISATPRPRERRRRSGARRDFGYHVA